METFFLALLPFSDVIELLPIPMVRRGKKSRARLDALIYTMIAERRATGRDHGDLLSMLLAAQDTEGTGSLSDKQVRDESLTILLAGHETTANALTWTWYLLSQNPDVERRLHDEIDRVLEGRLPALADLAAPAACSSASSPRRCACIRRPGWSAAGRSASTRSATSSCRRGR